MVGWGEIRQSGMECWLCDHVAAVCRHQAVGSMASVADALHQMEGSLEVALGSSLGCDSTLSHLHDQSVAKSVADAKRCRVWCHRKSHKPLQLMALSQCPPKDSNLQPSD